MVYYVYRFIFDHIQKIYLIAFFVCSDRLIEGNFLVGLFLGTQQHKQLIVNTARGIGGETVGFLPIECMNGFDKPNGSD